MKRNLFGKFKVIEKKTPPPLLTPVDSVFDQMLKDIEPTVEELLADAVEGQISEDEAFMRKCQKSFNRVFGTETHRVTGLVKSECSFYFPDTDLGETKHYCPLRQTEEGSISKQCIYCEDFSLDKLYKSSSFDNISKYPRCEHFEKAVLPVRTELEVAYRKKRNMRALTYFLVCKRCNAHFISSCRKNGNFPHTLLCDRCKVL